MSELKSEFSTGLLSALEHLKHPTWLLKGKQGIVYQFREDEKTGMSIGVKLCAKGEYILFEFDFFIGTYRYSRPLHALSHRCHRNNSSQFLAEAIHSTFEKDVALYDWWLRDHLDEVNKLAKLCKRACDRIAKEIV